MTTQLQETMKPITKLNSIDATLEEIKVGLLSAATGRDQVPVEVVKSLFKMMGWVIFGLVAILVFILTGKYVGFIGA